MVAESRSNPILIVDDHNTTLRILRNRLRRLGFSQIDEANDGAAALAKLRMRTYALVIADANIAPVDGQELKECMRADRRLCETPLLTVVNDRDGAQACQAGAISASHTAEGLRAKLRAVFGPF